MWTKLLLWHCFTEHSTIFEENNYSFFKNQNFAQNKDKKIWKDTQSNDAEKHISSSYASNGTLLTRFNSTIANGSEAAKQLNILWVNMSISAQRSYIPYASINSD